MKVCDLLEEKEDLLPVDEIAMLLFKKKAGLVKDPKRDKEKNYVGVSHSKSTLQGHDGKPLHLTFDNSTDSGEFEINSLTPLKIEKGGDLDRSIKKLFTKYEIESKKKTNYVVKSEATYLRELHLGHKLGRSAVKFVTNLIDLLRPADEGLEDEADAKTKVSKEDDVKAKVAKPKLSKDERN